MAKAKGSASKKGLDPELTRFLLMLAFDQELSSLYESDPAAFVDNWPHTLSATVKTALKSRDSTQIAKALIAQYGTTNHLVKSRARPRQKKARTTRSR